MISSLRSDISTKAATALATTVGFESASRSLSYSKNTVINRIYRLEQKRSHPPEHSHEFLAFDYLSSMFRHIQLSHTKCPSSFRVSVRILHVTHPHPSGTHASAAVFLTYGSLSCRPLLIGSTNAWITRGSGMEDMVRIARARIKGFRSLQS